MQTEMSLIMILLARVVQAVFNKRSSNEITGLSMTAVYSAYKSSISALLGLLLLLPSIGQVQITPLTILISIFSGLSLLATTYCSIFGMQNGAVSLVSMFSTAGLLIPVLAGALFFNQPIKPLQMAGMGLFFISAWLLIHSSHITYKRFRLKTVALLIGALVSNGATMLAQQLYTRYIPDGNISLFSFISFAFVAVIGLPLAFLLRRPSKEQTKPMNLNKSLYICGFALAVAVFVINQFATKLTTALPPIILFTVINGGATVIATLVAAIMYHERLSVRSVSGVLLGILSMVLIKMFS